MVLFFLCFLIYNKYMREVWKLINSINKKCDLEDKSIFVCLQELSIPVEKFLALFNVNPEIIDELFIRQLLNLLKNKSTRIFMDPSLDKDSEIEIFSKELNISISILENTLKIIWGETKEDETFEYYSTEFYAITKDGEIKTIHFASDVIKEKSKIKASGNYPLTSAHLKLSDKTNSLEVTIKNSLLMKDLKNIYRILYNFNYPLASNILKIYPGDEKEIKNGIDMNNFGTR